MGGFQYPKKDNIHFYIFYDIITSYSIKKKGSQMKKSLYILTFSVVSLFAFNTNLDLYKAKISTFLSKNVQHSKNEKISLTDGKNIYALDQLAENFINKKNCDKIINKKVFDICYSYKMKDPLYVSYTLYGNLVNKINIKKRGNFYTEKSIPVKYRAYSKDYVHSGYDRGHLANDADFDYNKKIVLKTYTMANIIPQSPKVNRKTWLKAEKYERALAVKLNSINVINGVVFSDNPKRIGKHKVAIPDAFWKIMYNNEKNFKKCFYYKNNLQVDVKKDKLKNHLIDCNQLL